MNKFSLIPQMGPMLWLMIFFSSLMNLFMMMFLMNSIYLKLNFKKKINYNMKMWQWMW